MESRSWQQQQEEARAHKLSRTQAYKLRMNLQYVGMDEECRPFDLSILITWPETKVSSCQLFPRAYQIVEKPCYFPSV